MYNDHDFNLDAVVALQEVGSRRKWMVSLLLEAPPCAPAPQAAPALHSSSQTTDSRAPDDQEQTGLPGALWSDKGAPDDQEQTGPGALWSDKKKNNNPVTKAL